MRNTIPLAYTAVPTNVTKSIGHVRQNSGHVPRIPSVTFTGMSVTLPESAVTLDRNTQLTKPWLTIQQPLQLGC